MDINTEIDSIIKKFDNKEGSSEDLDRYIDLKIYRLEYLLKENGLSKILTEEYDDIQFFLSKNKNWMDKKKKLMKIYIKYL
jgi:ribosome assembly protein YihI (activator of Der GTPase)